MNIDELFNKYADNGTVEDKFLMSKKAFTEAVGEIICLPVEAQVRRIEILKTIADDMKNDAAEFDGKPFDGRTVATYFGNHGAAIAALANILKSLLENKSA